MAYRVHHLGANASQTFLIHLQVGGTNNFGVLSRSDKNSGCRGNLYSPLSYNGKVEIDIFFCFKWDIWISFYRNVNGVVL